MKHFKIIFEPDNKSVDIHSGATILEAASKAGIILNTVCGGKGTCGKCAVTLKSSTGLTKEVLACNYTIEKNLTVFVPDKSRFFKQQILSHGIDRQMELMPAVKKHTMKLKNADVDYIKSALNEICVEHICHIEDDALKQLKFLLEDGKETTITGVSHLIIEDGDSDSEKNLYRVIAFEKGDTTSKIFGVAVDIGTTTIVAKLINMLDGKVDSTKAIDNRQAVFGADVIARIDHCKTEAGYAEMHKIIIDCINELIIELCGEANISSSDIYEISIAGNTTMNHIFLKFPVEQLGQLPFKAHSTKPHNISPDELAIKINSNGNVHTIANIAGFLGADTTAVALAVGMDIADKMTLVVDIGTNGELVLGTKDKMYAASCAAGPALEGAKISQGSRAVEGAIQSVIVNSVDIDIDVIGGIAPRSICGSGIIDAMAALVELGIVDTTGRFVEQGDLAGKIGKKIIKRIVDYNGQRAFVLAYNNDNDNEPIYFTQRDVRETQLAKAAIRVGIVLLQKRFNISDDRIEQVLLAGAFGNYVRRQSAKRIGLLPDVPIEKVHFVGNAAGTGAQMVLLSGQCRKLAAKLAEDIEHIELANETEFNMAYAECMMF